MATTASDGFQRARRKRSHGTKLPRGNLFSEQEWEAIHSRGVINLVLVLHRDEITAALRNDSIAYLVYGNDLLHLYCLHAHMHKPIANIGEGGLEKLIVTGRYLHVLLNEKYGDHLLVGPDYGTLTQNVPE